MRFKLGQDIIDIIRGKHKIIRGDLRDGMLSLRLTNLYAMQNADIAVFNFGIKMFRKCLCPVRFCLNIVNLCTRKLRCCGLLAEIR